MPTDIEWTDEVWNCIRGCSRVSSGCGDSTGGGCYAERQAYRFSGLGMPYEGLVRMTSKGPRWTGKVALVEEKLEQPLRWKRPRRIFVNSMSDLFHEKVEGEWIDKIFAVMALCPQHVFQVLTKRPERMRDYLTGRAAGGRYIWRAAQQIVMPRGRFKPDVSWPLPNVWLGVSCEDQKTADERISLLLQTPTAVRWISAEPLLSPVDINRHLYMDQRPASRLYGKLGLDWVVVGGESGPGARPMHPDWARSLRDQCVAAGVPYFFKQWGEHVPCSTLNAAQNVAIGLNERVHHTFVDHEMFYRVGKKAAGRLLDGREWNEYPKRPVTIIKGESGDR